LVPGDRATARGRPWPLAPPRPGRERKEFAAERLPLTRGER